MPVAYTLITALTPSRCQNTGKCAPATLVNPNGINNSGSKYENQLDMCCVTSTQQKKFCVWW